MASEIAGITNIHCNACYCGTSLIMNDILWWMQIFHVDCSACLPISGGSRGVHGFTCSLLHNEERQLQVKRQVHIIPNSLVIQTLLGEKNVISVPQKNSKTWCHDRLYDEGATLNIVRVGLLVTWAGPYFIKNVIIAFLNPEVEFLTPQSIWTTTQLSLQKLEMATKSIWTAENGLWDKFSLFPIRFKIRSLMSCNYN